MKENLPCLSDATSPALAALYPHDSDNELITAHRQFMSDVEGGWGAWTWARLQNETGRHRAYLFYFDVHAPDHPEGAWHASDYPYVFGNLRPPVTAADEATSELIRRYWVNFATSGDPNGPGLPVWKTFNTHSESSMVFVRAADGGAPATAGHPQRLPIAARIQALDPIMRCLKAPGAP